MAFALIEALGAFSYLQDNLPRWINRISELAAHTSIKHVEYSKAYRRHISYKSRRRRKSYVCFIRTDDLVSIAQSGGEGSPTAVEVVTTMTKDPTVPAYAGRKRSSVCAPSIDSSEQHGFVSTRHNVIIGYDGHTQNMLEEVTWEIGIARDNIRRSKISIIPHTGFFAGHRNKTASLSSHQPGGTDVSKPPALTCICSMQTGSGVVSATRTTGTRKASLFDFADTQLELAQGLCETAAYQVLRSGECGTELDGVKEKFKMLLEMASNEVGRLTKTQLQTIEEATPAKLPPNAKRSASPTLLPRVIP